MLKIGYMKYINFFPIFWNLEQKSEYNFVYGVPSELNRLMRNNELDVSPVSSLEYVSQPEKYRILDGIGLCAEKKVKSVLLQSAYPIENLEGKKINITGQSLTSAHLLRVILEKFYNIKPSYAYHNQPADARLLIGDEALKAYYERNTEYTYDLAELWHKFTGLPFVFSLWLISAEAAEKPEAKSLYASLRQISSTVHEKVDFYADQYILRSNAFSREQLTEYWRALYYTVNSKEINGLDLYYKMLGYDPQRYYYSGI